MDAELLFPLIALGGCIVIWIVMKFLDKEVKNAKREGREVKESGCANIGCVVGILMVIIGFIAINLQECSKSSHNYNHDINLEQPIHRDR